MPGAGVEIGYAVSNDAFFGAGHEVTIGAGVLGFLGVGINLQADAVGRRTQVGLARRSHS